MQGGVLSVVQTSGCTIEERMHLKKLQQEKINCEELPISVQSSDIVSSEEISSNSCLEAPALP